MRIVGGMWRGRALEAPEGRNVTRPTTDRTRESMASMVLSAFDLDLSEVRMLDAFAGSGAIGYELLSRGARSCTFCDADRKAVARIKRNGQALGAAREAHAVVGGLVLECEKRGCGLEDLTLDDLRAASDLFEDDIIGTLDPESIANARTTYGGTGIDAVLLQFEEAREVLEDDYL